MRKRDGHASYARVSELRLPVQLTLVFSRSVPIAEARETARRVLEGLGPAAGDEFPEELVDASLTCASMRRKVRLVDRG